MNRSRSRGRREVSPNPSQSIAVRNTSKDKLIAALRQELYDLKSSERNFEGLSDEIRKYE